MPLVNTESKNDVKWTEDKSYSDYLRPVKEWIKAA